GVLRKQPAHALRSPCFLVGVREQDDVSLELYSRIDHMTLQEQHARHVYRQHSLVVECTSAVYVAIAQLTAKGVGRPWLVVGRYHVHVRHEHHRLRLPGASESCHYDAAVLRWLEEP